jgi:hypothetical protein
MRILAHPASRTLLAGTLIGLVILGVGGRIVMAIITMNAGGTPRFTPGGTLTVVMLGAASGLAGGLFAIVSRYVTMRLVPRYSWTQYVLLGVLLLAVTMRGLRGTAQPGSWYFYLLVALYGTALVGLTRRPQSQRP